MAWVQPVKWQSGDMITVEQLNTVAQQAADGAAAANAERPGVVVGALLALGTKKAAAATLTRRALLFPWGRR